jgi:alpha-1,3-mannosylglycoprotein beta-1,4-N-acetylglucosaminyltransferase C
MTLDSLIENLSPKELSEVHIVVFLADFKEKAREKIRNTVSSKYRKYVDDNLINVVQAPRDFYPQLTSLPRTYGDSPNRVFWRSKQNVDYAFLFKYCENLSDYYMQLEDDVTTTNGYLTVIKNCIKQYEYTRWAFLQTVGWGFVGKLFKNAELDYFARMLRLFYNDMPCDWLIYNFNRWRGVNSTSPSLRVCGNIFFHKGKQSSRLSSLRNTM